MRRHRRWALAWAIGCVLAIAGIAIVPAATVEKAEPPSGEATVPFEFQWIVVSRCLDELGPRYAGSGFAFGESGQGVRVTLTVFDDDGVGRTLSLDSPETVRMQACVDAFSYEVVPPPTRGPNEVEVVVVDRWVRGFAQPCAASHGVDSYPVVFQPGDVTQQQTASFAQLMTAYATSERPLDELLEIRRDCPLVPSFLASQGIAW